MPRPLIFIRYNCTAIISSLSDWISFWILHQFGFFFVYSQMIARLIGGLTSFTINKYWSFKSLENKHFFLEGRRFALLFIFSYSLSNSCLYFLVESLQFQLFWSKLFADGICYFVNFFIMKSYVYVSERSITKYVRNYLYPQNRSD
jgi:putative flippase GtrA